MDSPRVLFNPGPSDADGLGVKTRIRWVGICAVAVLTVLAMAFVGAESSTPQSVYAFGTEFRGSTGLVGLNQPITGIAAHLGGKGYWTVTKGGEVSPFGTAPWLGSLNALPLSRPIVGIAATPSGKGYWLVANDGGVFTFGDAVFAGSLAGSAGARDVVAIAANPVGTGYWLVTQTGKVVNFGDAPFLGSADALPLNGPIVGMASNPSGSGYWLVGRDGGVFTFGAAAFHGSMGANPLNRAAVGISRSAGGAGYLLASSDGGVYAFGDASFHGSLAGSDVSQPTVALATAPNGGYWLALTGHLARAGVPRTAPSYLMDSTNVITPATTGDGRATTYRQLSSSNACTFSILGSDGSPRHSDLGPGRHVVRLRMSDTGFTSTNCGVWSSDLFPATPSLTSTVGDGTWLLGIDITGGTWTASGGVGCHWSTQSDLAGMANSELDSGPGIGATPGAPVTATLKGSEVAFTSTGCGMWTHQ